MLSVFGPELGPEKQTQVALLLLLICIVLEIYGDPYLIETTKHNILGQLELSALLIEWVTMWSGLINPRTKEQTLGQKFCRGLDNSHRCSKHNLDDLFCRPIFSGQNG